MIEELNEIAPFRRSTRGDREIFAIYYLGILIFSYRNGISFSTRKWMIMSIFYNYSWLVIHFCESSGHKTNDSMLEIRCIVKKYWLTGINIFECFLKMDFGSSFASFIQVFEFTKKFIGSSFSSKEPTKGGKWCIHTTRCIDSRSNLESDDICISFDLLSSFEKIPESNRFGLLHLPEPKCRDDSIFSCYWHTVSNGSE